MKLSDLNATLVIEPDAYGALPPHVAAFCSYLILGDRDRLDDHASLAGDCQSYQAIAAAGYALAKDPSRDGLVAAFKGAFEHLSGRIFFAAGRTPRFEVDSIALLGVALGAKAARIPQAGAGWLDKGVPPKLIIFNGFLVGARAQHCQGQIRQRDRFATTVTIPTRNGDFGATRAGSEWPARRAHSTACPNA